jgi:hypothetical protein
MIRLLTRPIRTSFSPQFSFLLGGFAALLLALTACSPTAAPEPDAGDGDGDGDGVIPIDLGSGGTVDSSAGGSVFENIADPVGGTTGEDPEFCQQTKVDFVPKTPTAYVLVDMSGSMGSNDENFWEPLKAALLPALETLQADVRLGFGTYTSTQASQCGATPTVLDDLGTIGLNNYAEIASMYNAYPDPLIGDTPTSYAIEQAVSVLLADTEAPGERFIILVTDGNPDFCDNIPAKCAQDATVAALQTAHEQGVTTLVFGLEAQNQQPLEANIMALFANAGDGQPVSWADALPLENRDPPASSLSDECRSEPYPTLLGAGMGTSIGTYGTTNGTAEAFLGGDPATLVESLRTQVEGLKSCVFDLTAAGLEIKAGSENTGVIKVDQVADTDPAIPMSDWRMNSTTELEILGPSCELWKSDGVTEFFAGFPCDAVIPIVIK